MEMKQYLLDTFRFNDETNRRMLRKVRSLPDKQEFIRYFSHLVNSQNKWLARILQDSKSVELSWWDPVYSFDELEDRWRQSLEAWTGFLMGRSEQDLYKEVEFTGYDGGRWAAKLVDIALQLNYHSIHHRAQMQVLIRQQGLEPDFIDYIGTKYRKLTESDSLV
jgi:uncharacterized damage-inducible protein DinB